MRRPAQLTLLVALFACQSYVAVPVQPVTLVAVQQHAKVRVATKADVLLVIDDSLSMSGKQDRLAAALANFTKQLDSLNPPVDYQAAVVTTTVSERFGACGPAGDPGAAQQCDSDWGATGFACDNGFACFRSFPQAGQLYDAPGVPQPVIRRDDMTAQQFADLLAKQVAVGTGGARQPQGMEAMKLALAAPNGFLRDGAKVVVAFFTDAEDCSDPGHRFAMLTRDPATGNIVDRCAQGSTSLEPVATYVQFLRDLKNGDGTPKEIEVGAIVSLTNGTQDPGVCSNPACDAACDAPQGQAACQQRCANAPTYDICMADCAAECHSFCSGQVPGRRYLELAFSFNGFAANVCSDDASGPLGRLAAVIGIPKQVVLRAPPSSPDLVAVTVQRGGATVSCTPGVDFDLAQTADGQVVLFKGNCVLQPDDVWDVRYLATK